MIGTDDKRKLMAEIKSICAVYDMDATELMESYSGDRSDGIKIYEIRIQIADNGWKHGIRRKWKDTG